MFMFVYLLVFYFIGFWPFSFKEVRISNGMMGFRVRPGHIGRGADRKRFTYVHIHCSLSQISMLSICRFATRLKSKSGPNPISQ